MFLPEAVGIFKDLAAESKDRLQSREVRDQYFELQETFLFNYSFFRNNASYITSWLRRSMYQILLMPGIENYAFSEYQN